MKPNAESTGTGTAGALCARTVTVSATNGRSAMIVHRTQRLNETLGIDPHDYSDISGSEWERYSDAPDDYRYSARTTTTTTTRKSAR